MNYLVGALMQRAEPHTGAIHVTRRPSHRREEGRDERRDERKRCRHLPLSTLLGNLCNLICRSIFQCASERALQRGN